MNKDSIALESIKHYYGKVLKSNQDLKTTACCSTESFPLHIQKILNDIHPDVLGKFYGCGSPLPPELLGRTVLDLGSGSGRDSFILSRLVGPNGRVIGIDMTGEQLDTARSHIGYHMNRFGFTQPNVEFIHGYIEDLQSLNIQDNSIDVVVSNCVINLSPDKERVFSEIFRVLRPGGELFFADVFSDRRIPANLSEDPVILGECLGGALYLEDFRRLLARIGCLDYRVVTQTNIELTSPEIQQKAGMIGFKSITIRAFKLNLEDRCEDYGQVAFYHGTIPESPHAFLLDDHHLFKTRQPLLVCSNTASMLKNTRYSPHFNVVGNTQVHFGLFDCSPKTANDTSAASSPGGACC